MGRQRSAVQGLIRTLPRANRPLTICLAALVVVGGLVVPLYIVLSGVLIGAIAPAVRGGAASPAATRLFLAAAAIALVYLAQKLIESATQTVAMRLGRRLRLLLQGDVMDACLARSVRELEDPAVAEELSIARGVADGDRSPDRVVPAVAMIARWRIIGVVSGVLLLPFHWWAPLALAPVWLLAGQRLVRKQRIDVSASTTLLRRADYLRRLALEPAAAKELRIFGLRAWTIDRYTQHAHDGVAAWKRATGLGWLTLTVPVFVAAHLIVLIALGRAAVNGMSAGDLALYLQAVMGMWHLQGPTYMVADVHREAAPILAIRRLREHTPRSPGGAQPAAEMPREAIRFEGVSFSYGAQPVFDGLDLTLTHGRSVAIVGENGAGKTTLVKLLARLYEPDRGHITIDGLPLADLDPGAWRRSIAVIFQDFVRYPFDASFNVTLGEPDTQARNRAAEEAGARALIEGLPHGWDTVLSRAYAGGTDLSGGQWQRVALARALYALERGARVLILDEPTANLDVRAEAALFDRFLDLTRGATTILVSHRFSTVRRADVICVLRDGRVTEQGSHDELLALGGRYAEMFTLQASHFAEAVHDA